jgi:hypothetical protein
MVGEQMMAGSIAQNSSELIVESAVYVDIGALTRINDEVPARRYSCFTVARRCI